MKLKISVVLLFALVSLSSYAGNPPYQGCTSLGCIGKLDNIYLNPNGTVQVPPMGGGESNLGCTLADGAYITLKRSHPHFDEMYAMMLTAHAANKDIYLRTVANSTDCEVFYAVMY